MRLHAKALLLISLVLPAAMAGDAGAKEVRSELKVRVGDKAPAFTLTSSDGKKVELSDFSGRIVLLDFYRAHW